ncbi:MAG: universal stress protein [Planctomycetes bacterium]|nr:universal stress protein [Planctomycetota bacterium]
MKVTHILLTTDLSEEANRGFVAAREMAARHDAKITLLNVVENLQVAPHGAPFAPPQDDPQAPALAASALAGLEERRMILGDDIEVNCATTFGTDVGVAVADYAADNGCDMIVMSSHGRTGFRRLVLGSVAETVLRHAGVPVLCVPQQG